MSFYVFEPVQCPSDCAPDPMREDLSLTMYNGVAKTTTPIAPGCNPSFNVKRVNPDSLQYYCSNQTVLDNVQLQNPENTAQSNENWVMSFYNESVQSGSTLIGGTLKDWTNYGSGFDLNDYNINLNSVRAKISMELG